MASHGSRGLFDRALGAERGVHDRAAERARPQRRKPTSSPKRWDAGMRAMSSPVFARFSVADLLTEAPVDGAQPDLPGGDFYAGGTPRWQFTPVVDGVVLADQPRTLFDEGDIADVPYLLGSNSDEGTLFLVLQTPVSNDQEYAAALERRFGEPLASEIVAEYPTSAFDSPQDALARVTGDALLVCLTRDTAIRASDAGLSVFMYNFARPIPIPALQPLDLRATHGAEIGYVFGSVGPPVIGEDDLDLSLAMRRYWGRFAASGDPNGADDPSWPPFSSTSDVRLNLDVPISTVDDFRADLCAFWESTYDAGFAE